MRQANGRLQFAFQTPIQGQIDNRHQSQRRRKLRRTTVPAFQSHESIFLSSVFRVWLESRALTTADLDVEVIAESSSCAAVDPKNRNNIMVVGGRDEEYCNSLLARLFRWGQDKKDKQEAMLDVITCRAHNGSGIEKGFLVVIGGRDLSSVEVLDLEEEPQEQKSAKKSSF